METKTLNLYSFKYTDIRAYIAAILFITGNIALPQLLHLVPQGGTTWLPIYFFTLIAAYKYGWRVGLMTAVLSPLVNSVLFGMPPVSALPVIVVKSVLLAAAASIAAHRLQRISIPILIGVVLAYQITGTVAEWLICGSWHTAFQDFRIALPGMLLQVFGGYCIIKYIIYK